MDVGAANGTDTNTVVDPIGNRCQKLFQDFLEEWQDGEEVKYLKAARDLVKPERNTLVVSMKDVERYNAALAQSIQDEYYRVYPFLCSALKNYVTDRADMTMEKEYYVAFSDVDAQLKVRDLTSIRIGTLVRITGQVVRTHPVHPELVLGTFICADCQTSVPDVEQQFKFTQPSICRNPVCNNRSRFTLDVAKSRFVDFQKVRIQEIQSELPRGSIPRSVEIILRAEAVESAQPGDRCDFIGTLIVVPDVGSIQLPGARAESDNRHKGNESEGVRGLKSLGVRDLHHRMAFLACNVLQGTMKLGEQSPDNAEEATPATIKERMSPAEWNTIYKMSTDKNLYQNLINSLFPTIHGNEEVKRGTLLMLFGGVGKTTHDMTKLRGDINICIVGDPSTAKSQLLKQVAEFSPRAVYTSGKASSAAGLTAAVVRDEESSEFVIEAGALMLADNGVCCIDEFDKMDPHDQVAIHEAMEQQTISITKAGVKATLNARTSILAAANPISGRYDRTKSLKQNIAMTAPIMSRFDLFFILVDDCNEVTDYAIARRIVDLHTRAEQSVERIYEPADIARYISFARLFKPKITEESMDYLVEQYRHLRQRDTGGGFKSSWRITVRQLESMVRLSESMARMGCSDQVLPKHVKEAYRLLNKSIIRVDQPDIQFEDEEAAAAMLEEDEMEVDADEQNVASPDPNADAGVPASQNASKKQLRLTYEEYKTMASLFVHYLRRKETEDVRKKDLVNWYIEETLTSENIESQEELVERKQIVEKVLDRLAHNDNVLVPLNAKNTLREEEVIDDNPILIVHPNYIEDE